MSRLSEMIQELCPDGVEYRKLGEIGTLIRGKRFVKNDFIEVGVPAIHYGELYTHYGISASEVKTHIRPEIALKMRYAQPNDIVIVGAGETIEDIGIGVAWLGKRAVAVHDACYIFHHELNPVFISYILRTEAYHRQLKKYITTGKISSISANGIGQAIIPVPPLPIQNEIVKMLDNFTELTAEHSLRKKQYNFYRDSLLNFATTDRFAVQIEGQKNQSISEVGRLSDAFEMKYARLGEIGHFYGGLNGKSKEDFQGGNEPFITYMEVYSNLALKGALENLVRIGAGECQNTVAYGDIMFTGSSETREECGISCVMTEPLKQKVYLNSFCFGYRFDQSDMLLPAFSKYLFRSKNIRAQIIKTASGVTRFNVSKKKMENVIIPIPPLEVQAKIVSILDRFDTLCNDLTQGLPAEIAARRKQYEYYRDKLLTFRRKGA